MEHLTSIGPARRPSGCGETLCRRTFRLRRAALAAVLAGASWAAGLPAHAAAPHDMPQPLAWAPPQLPSPVDAIRGHAPRPAAHAAKIRPGSMPSYAAVQQVNRAVNQATRYVSDQDLYGRHEFWTVARDAGDCEDYALAKRAALLAAGTDPAHLRLLSGWIDTGEYHLVLVVRTEQGDYVLDARHPQPMKRQDLEALGYRWHSIEEGGRWFAIL